MANYDYTEEVSIDTRLGEKRRALEKACAYAFMAINELKINGIRTDEVQSLLKRYGAISKELTEEVEPMIRFTPEKKITSDRLNSLVDRFKETREEALEYLKTVDVPHDLLNRVNGFVDYEDPYGRL